MADNKLGATYSREEIKVLINVANGTIGNDEFDTEQRTLAAVTANAMINFNSNY